MENAWDLWYANGSAERTERERQKGGWRRDTEGTRGAAGDGGGGGGARREDMEGERAEEEGKREKREVVAVRFVRGAREATGGNPLSQINPTQTSLPSRRRSADYYGYQITARAHFLPLFLPSSMSLFFSVYFFPWVTLRPVGVYGSQGMVADERVLYDGHRVNSRRKG